jgi:glycosyltransferase involved in cell wall biosynthesis
MALGCPVLATNRSSVPEICHDAPFYFDPADQASFNSGLLQAVQDDDRRKQAVARGRQVAAEYNWQKCGEQTLDLYRQCQ